MLLAQLKGGVVKTFAAAVLIRLNGFTDFCLSWRK